MIYSKKMKINFQKIKAFFSEEERDSDSSDSDSEWGIDDIEDRLEDLPS